MSLSEPLPSKRIAKAMRDGVHAKVYPQNLYTLRLDELGKKGIRGAKLVGCQYTGNLGGPEDQSIQVDLGSTGKAPQVTEFRYGEMVKAARNAIKEAKKWADGRPEGYELRLLRIPALSMQAVWLKGEGEATDQMFPYQMPGAPMPRRQPIDEFMIAVERAAQRRGDFDDSPRKVPPG